MVPAIVPRSDVSEIGTGTGTQSLKNPNLGLDISPSLGKNGEVYVWSEFSCLVFLEVYVWFGLKKF